MALEPSWLKGPMWSYRLVFGLFSPVGPLLGIRSPSAFCFKLAAIAEETIGKWTPIVIVDEGS